MLGSWAVGFYPAATVVLAVAFAAMAATREPARRLAWARAAVAGLWLLAVWAAFPSPPAPSPHPGLAREGAAPASIMIAPDPKPSPLLTTGRCLMPFGTLAEPRPAVATEEFATPEVSNRRWEAVCASSVPILASKPRGCPTPSETVQPSRPDLETPIGCETPVSVSTASAPIAPSSDPIAVGLGSLVVVAGLGALMRLGLGAWVARRMLRDGVEPPGAWRSVLASLGDDRARSCRLLACPGAPGPLAVGLLRPTIVLPAGVEEGIASSPRIEAAIAHEWAHIRRGDLRLLASTRLLSLLLGVHPAYWLLRRAIRADQEAVADAIAVESAGGDPISYAESLIEWARPRPAGFRVGIGPALGIGLGGRSELRRRVVRLLGRGSRVESDCPRAWSWAATSATAALVVALVATGIGRVPAAPTPHDCSSCEQASPPAVVSAFLCPEDESPTSGRETNDPASSAQNTRRDEQD